MVALAMLGIILGGVSLAFGLAVNDPLLIALGMILFGASAIVGLRGPGIPADAPAPPEHGHGHEHGHG